jgi:hypothetical protein
MRKRISMRLKAERISLARRSDEATSEVLTWNEYVLVGSSHILERSGRKESHVLVIGVPGNILIRAVVKCNEDIQQNYTTGLASNINSTPRG